MSKPNSPGISKGEAMISDSLFDFAKNHGLLKSQAVRLARKGRISGAFQDLTSRKWFVNPSGELLEPLQKRTTWRDRFNGGAL